MVGQVINLELMDKPPESRAANNPWPMWPRIFRIDYGHAEAAAAFGKDPRKYNVMSKRFVLNQGRVVGIEIVQARLSFRFSPNLPFLYFSSLESNLGDAMEMQGRDWTVLC